MGTKEKEGILVDFNNRFSELQKLETIYLAAPHQYEMQKLIGCSVAEAVGSPENSESERFIEVIEIGVGKGFTTHEILAAVSNVKIIGVDNNDGMINQARKNMGEYITNGRLELHHEDALKFLGKFPENSVDTIASGLTIHNLQKDYRRKVLEQIFLILKPGGKFVTADKIMPDDKEILHQEVEWQTAQFQNIPDEKTRNEWIKHYEDDMLQDVIMREGELVKMMEEIGFRDIIVSDRKHLEALLVAKK